jgi:hypothetical protein
MGAMFKQHRMRSFMADFGPLATSDFTTPSVAFVKKRIAQSLAEDSILKKEIRDLGGKKPVRIGKVELTIAAFAQVQDMWAYAHRCKTGGGPKIPLKYYTHGIHRKDGVETVDVEIHPGLDTWEFIFDD